MIEIIKSEYYKVMPLVDTGLRYPEVLAVIEGNNPGIVYVDDIEDIKAAMIWNQGMEGYYFIGDGSSEKFVGSIDKLINDEVAPFLTAKNFKSIEFSATNPRWDSVFEKVFHDRKLRYWDQFTYCFEGKEVAYVSDKPIDYDILSVRSDMFDFGNYSNGKYYKDVLVEFWGDIDNLKRNGNCYLGVVGHKLIGVAYSGFAASESKTIGIEVDSDYRKKDVGYNLAYRCLVDIVSENKTVWWDCMDENIGSQKLAEKLGFRKINTYKCFAFDL